MGPAVARGEGAVGTSRFSHGRWTGRSAAVAVALALGTLGLVGQPAVAAGCGSTSRGIWNDFNGDGSDELPIGVPSEDVGAIPEAGAVNVLYGPGPTATGDQFWSEASAGILSAAEDYDSFGQALAAGDFNGDGCGDLAVGVPHQDVSGVSSAGAVHIIYGSSLGLTEDGDAQWTQNTGTMLDTPADAEFFGWSLATGKFNADAYADLAIGVLYENDNGAVAVMYGSSAGLTDAGNQLWSQDSPGINGQDFECQSEFFGQAVAAANFNGDGVDDLAAGVPGEDLGGAGCGGVGYMEEVGAVNVIYGTAAGLSSAGDRVFHQNSTSVQEEAEANDRFGEELASGDFDGDGAYDLAVGVPDETIGGAGAAGVAQVLYGDAGGLSGAGDQVWSEESNGVPGSAETSDSLGFALLAGNFGKGPQGDLAIGTPGQEISGQGGAGWVHVLYGSSGAGLTASNDDVWSQDSPSVLDAAEVADGFGSEFGDAKFEAGVNSLAVGVSGEDIGFIGGAGAVHVLHGSTTGLSADGDQFWHQDRAGVLDVVEEADAFGAALAFG